MKVPTFGETNTTNGYNFTTNKWFNVSDPVIGVAYHF